MFEQLPTADENGIVTMTSPRSAEDTVARLMEMVHGRGMTLFATIDQSAEAQRVGLKLRETVLVIFGNPIQGTPVMAASPLAALDLPLKVLVWADGEETRVSYYAPAVLAARHGLDPELANNLAGIDALIGALVAP